MREDPKPQYFYTTNHPHKWNTGPSMSTVNPDNDFMPIESLEEAKELAEKFKVGGWNEDRCVTTYGIQYKVNEQE
jgi:hypothetical protein